MVPQLSIWFRQFDGMMQFLTYYVWSLEWVGPVLIFSPLFHRPLRALFQAAFITMHVGFSLFLLIGFFPWVSIVMNLAFTQGWVWDRLGAALRRRQADDMFIHYDADCDFCRKVCLLLHTFLILTGVRIVTAQSDPRIHALMQEHNSWVVRDGAGRERVRWDAIRAVFEASPIFFWLAPVVAPRGCGDCIYETVARNRGRLSNLSARLLAFRPVHVRPTVFGSVLAAVFAGFVFVQNLSTIPALDIRTGAGFRAVRQALGLYQNWTMFAPYPEVTSAWPVIPGVLTDGTVVDVYRGTEGAPGYDRPAPVSAVYENERWRKYISNVEDLSYRTDRPEFALNWARYLCRRWNEDAAADRRLSIFEIHFQVEWTRPPGQPKGLETRRVWRHDCLN